MTTCAVSVIIPLYNAEKYIGQCLLSVLASEFKNFEVIVVDDCSTDNSRAEVERLLPYFDGRLKILSTETNSGGAGIPRNVGIRNAAGKYVTFVDNDDFILPTALGNFFEVAENFQADVVYAEKYFVSNSETTSGQDLKIMFVGAVEDLVYEPTPESHDLLERIKRDIAGKFVIAPWGKFYRREFLTENRIDFPQMRFSEDMVFCFKCLCLAENYIRVPHVTNIRRELNTSTGRMIVDSQEGVRLWLNALTKNISELDNFTGKLESIINPDIHRAILRHYIVVHFNMIKNLFQGLQPHEVQKIFYDELQNPALDATGKNLVAAYLYAERFAAK